MKPTQLARACPIASTLALALLFAPRLAPAAVNDARARARGDAAIDQHYLAMDLKKAEAELKAAIALCARDKCSPGVVATLHRDLAVVYIAGKRKGPGEQQMRQALKLDPKLALNPDLTTEDVRSVFLAAGGVDTPAEPQPEAEVFELEEEVEVEVEPEVEFEAGKLGPHRVGGGLQLDSMLHRPTSEACTTGGAYFCYDDAGHRYGFRGEEPLSEEAGNEVKGGLALATVRVMASYDYHLLPTWMVGGRLGFAFNGAPVDDVADQQSFLPLHLEVRLSRLFTKTPFQKGSFTPYAGLAAGVAQVDSRVPVEVWVESQPPPEGTRYELKGYKKTGRSFVSLSLGSFFQISDELAPFAELTFMQMIPVTAQVFAVRAGATYRTDW